MRLILSRMVWNFDIHFTDQGEEALPDWGEQKTWLLIDKKPLIVSLVDVRGSNEEGLRG